MTILQNNIIMALWQILATWLPTQQYKLYNNDVIHGVFEVDLHMICNMLIVFNKCYIGVMCLCRGLCILLYYLFRTVFREYYSVHCECNVIARELTLANIIWDLLIMKLCQFHGKLLQSWMICSDRRMGFIRWIYYCIFMMINICWNDYLLWVYNGGGWFHRFGYFPRKPNDG